MTFTDHLIDPIEEGVDLMIRVGPLKDSSGLVARRLTVQRQVICASPEYLRSRGEPKSLEDLQDHSCIAGLPSLPNGCLNDSGAGLAEVAFLGDLRTGQYAAEEQRHIKGHDVPQQA